MSSENVTTQSAKLSIELPGGQGEIFIKRWQPANQTSDRPLILLHDSLGCVELWRDFPAQLAALLGCEVIAYDRLGFGQSSARNAKPGTDFIWQEADCYFPLIKAQAGIGKYSLLGHSVGGAMAIAIAASDSDCQSVITEAAQAFVEPLTLEGIKVAQKAFQNDEQCSKLSKWHGDKTAWVLNAWIDVWLSPEFADWSLASRISDVTCPVLALHGDNDEYGSKAFPEFISRNTNGKGRMVLLDNCGHVPHKQQNQVVLDLIKAFDESTSILA